jgi:ATP-dependent DNA helicase DinG
MPDDVPLGDRVAMAFAADGPLARKDTHLTHREVQLRMAAQVAEAIEGRTALVAEAGTGVGKTFAYLVPLLLSGRRALVSTATKSLQDQLFLRDLPWLRDALGLPVTLALLKGRSSYLCLQRLPLAREADTLSDRWALRALARVEAWAPGTRSGDLAEIEGLDDRSPVIPLVTSTRENCLGGECPQFKPCHLMRSRREAMAADLVVVNHHLFFADMALRESGVAELLPTVDAVVFDEAHQLVDAGVQFLGTTLSTGQIIDFSRDLLATGLGAARGLRPWAELAGALELGARQLRLACAGPLLETRAAMKLRWQDRAERPDLKAALQALHAAAIDCGEAARQVSAIGPDFDRLAQRAAALAELVQGFGQPADASRVRWIELSAQQARLIEAPLDIRDMLTEQRQAAAKAWVFTSATLGDDDRLSWFTGATALEDATVSRLGSPFDYRSNARLWVARPFPRPSDVAHPAAVGELAARCARALGGPSCSRPRFACCRRSPRHCAGSSTPGACRSRCWCRAASLGARCCSTSAPAVTVCCSAPTASGKASTCRATPCNVCSSTNCRSRRRTTRWCRPVSNASKPRAATPSTTISSPRRRCR